MSDATLSIVHYKQPELLRRCLGQLQSLNLPSSWEIIVVENSPGNEVASIIRSEYNYVRLINNQKNNGFGGGHNLAFMASHSKYFFVLNPDIMVLEDSLSILIKCLEEYPKAALVGPCLLNPDYTMQNSARRFYDWKTVFGRRLPFFKHSAIDDRHLMKDSDLSKTQKVNWVLGAAMAIRRQAFPIGQLFDPRYRLYFEDVDLCYFIQKKGWDVIYCPDSKMIHDHQRASAKGFNRTLFIHFSSWIKFWLKSKGFKQ